MGVSHVGCSMAALIAKSECIAGEKDRHEDEAYTGWTIVQWGMLDLWRKAVVLSHRGSLICQVAFESIEHSYGTTAISGEKNESRIRQSVALIVITKLNGDFLNRDAYGNMGYV